MLSGILTQNRWQKIFSLLLASLIWFAVHSGLTLGLHNAPIGRDVRTFESRPITVLSSATDLGRYEVRPNGVTVLLRGEAARLAAIRPQDLEVYVNLIDSALLPMTRPIHIYPPSGTEVVAVIPAEVRIERLPSAVLPSPH